MRSVLLQGNIRWQYQTHWIEIISGKKPPRLQISLIRLRSIIRIEIVVNEGQRKFEVARPLVLVSRLDDICPVFFDIFCVRNYR